MFAPLVFTMSVIAIIYTSLVALMQEDIKKLIAYSSVAHMGFVTMGIFTMTTQGIEGAIFQMISHGLVSGALFLCVGVVYDRLHTREIAAYGGLRESHADLCDRVHGVHHGQCRPAGHVGLCRRVPDAARRVPLQSLGGAAGHHGRDFIGLLCALALCAGDVWTAGKAGPRGDDRSVAPRMAVLAPLVVLTIYYGVHPAPVLDAFAASTDALMVSTQAALAATKTAALHSAALLP
jgi:NADH-quinone oxidoreductase subunit M